MSTAEDLKQQGIELFEQHDYEAAIRAFQQAKDAYLEADQPDMAAEMKVNMGLVHRSLGETQQAIELMQDAIHTFEDTNDDLRRAQVLGNMGGVYQALNENEKAELAYREAANIFSELGKYEMYADTMMALGGMQVRNFQLLTGAATYQTALERKENLTGTQKILKQLSDFIYKLGGTPALESSQSNKTD